MSTQEIRVTGAPEEHSASKSNADSKNIASATNRLRLISSVLIQLALLLASGAALIAISKVLLMCLSIYPKASIQSTGNNSSFSDSGTMLITSVTLLIACSIADRVMSRKNEPKT